VEIDGIGELNEEKFMFNEKATGYDQLFENLEENLALLRDESGNVKDEHKVLYNLSNALCGLGSLLRVEFQQLHDALRRLERPKPDSGAMLKP
jgi:hypothetical protein